jgi:uncharacterized protein (TIGR00369 family)
VDDADDMRRRITDLVPYWKTLGFELISITKEEAVFEGTYRQELSQGNVLHGGVLAALIDSACAGAALAYTYPDSYVTSIALQVTYLRPVTSGRIRAVGRCVRAGGRVLFCEAEVYDEDHELVGKGAGQMMRIPLPAKDPSREGSL